MLGHRVPSPYAWRDLHCVANTYYTDHLALGISAVAVLYYTNKHTRDAVSIPFRLTFANVNHHHQHVT